MSKSLFIANDSAKMRKIIKRKMQTSGFDIDQTEEASNGNESPDKLNANALDIICILN
jgi:hypothetical protein